MPALALFSLAIFLADKISLPLFSALYSLYQSLFQQSTANTFTESLFARLAVIPRLFSPFIPADAVNSGEQAYGRPVWDRMSAALHKRVVMTDKISRLFLHIEVSRFSVLSPETHRKIRPDNNASRYRTVSTIARMATPLPSTLHLHHLLALLFLTTVRKVQADHTTEDSIVCYAPDGVSIANKSFAPCNRLGITQSGVHSSCCQLNLDSLAVGTRDLCTATGLCLNDGVIRRGFCTDKTWKSSACVKVCDNVNVFPPPLFSLLQFSR